MTAITLKQISIYPIKSTAGIHLSNSWVDTLGLSFDRRFVLTDLQGRFITARTDEKLCLIQASLTATGLILTAPNMPALTVEYQQLSSDYEDITLWGDTIKSQLCTENHHRWFSLYLQKPCQLMYFGEQSTRTSNTNNTSETKQALHNTEQTAFADGYPLLLISQASLDDLNQRATNHTDHISMSQFRPNVVVENCDAFAEDTWSRIQIGEVEFDIRKPCTRCIFTTIDPVTAKKHNNQEPLTTLKNYRQTDNGDILFGQNIVPLNKGQIKTSDEIVILEKKSPPIFSFPASKKAEQQTSPHISEKLAPQLSLAPAPQSITSTSFTPKKKPTITFESWNKTHKGNNKETLLEQGEDAGLILPYSCRAGMCGRCKVKLKSGEVKELANDGLTDAEQQQNYILICSCIPTTDVVISRA